jgi:mono/diheme cytochrome c family protein
MKLWSRSAVAALVMLPGAAGAVELGNAESGHDYARKVCAGCHAVEKGATISPAADVPSFQDVADTTGMSPRALVVWLQTSHPNMPNLILPPDDMDNVVAYIMSLRSPAR